eukprot:COSAG01_NODE_13182_length_1624_cov_0.878689_1_plen_256_part_10
MDGLQVPSGLHLKDGVVYIAERNTSSIIAFDKYTKAEISRVQTGSLGLNGIDVDGHGQLWFSDGPSSTVSRVLVEVPCNSSASPPPAAVPISFPSRVCPWVVNTSVTAVHTQHMAGYMNLSAFIGIDDYADAQAHHCGGNSITIGAETAGMPTADANGTYRINNDALLMSGYMCHICLPTPCHNGGTCAHVPSGAAGAAHFLNQRRNLSGFTCACPSGFSGDICQTRETCTGDILYLFANVPKTSLGRVIKLYYSC